MKDVKKGLSIALAAASLGLTFGGTSCASSEKPQEFSFTVFSDVHYGDHNYNDFACTNGLKKLRQILGETSNSEFYINLGDTVDYLNAEQTSFYDEVAAVLRENKLNIYHPENKNYVDGQRTIYNVMGNHETAFIHKSKLKEYVPYVEGVGSVYSFKYKDVFFLCLDANFDRATGGDETSVMRTSTEFTLPKAVLEWAKTEAQTKIDNSVKGIVWLSHIAFQDIDEASRWELVDYLNQYRLPLTIFEGHTHVENYFQWYDEEDSEKVIATVYTLPAVTSGSTYKYYNITFSDGKVKSIDKHIDATIGLE